MKKKLLHRPLKVCSPNELFTLYEYLLYTNQSEILHIIEILAIENYLFTHKNANKCWGQLSNYGYELYNSTLLNIYIAFTELHTINPS